MVTTAIPDIAQPQSTQAGIQGFMDFLKSHKDDADTFFDYIHANQKPLTDTLNFIARNRDGLQALMDAGASEEGRKKLIEHVSGDPGAKRLMEFMLADENRGKMKEMFGLLGTTPTSTAAMSTVTMIGKDKNEAELKKMAKFMTAPENADNLDKLSRIESRIKPNQDFKKEVLKTGDVKLIYFASTKGSDMLRQVNGFIKANEQEIMDVAFALQRKGNALAGSGDFLLHNEENMRLFLNGMPGIEARFGDIAKDRAGKEKGLNGLISRNQSAANTARDDEARADIARYDTENQKAGAQVTSEIQKFMEIKNSNPEAFKAIVALEQDTLKLAAHGMVNSSEQAQWQRDLEKDKEYVQLYPELKDITPELLGRYTKAYAIVDDFVKQNLPNGQNTAAQRDKHR